MLRFKLIKDIESVKNLQGEWEALLYRSKSYLAFMNPWLFIELCQRHNFKPRVILAYNSSNLVAILPLTSFVEAKNCTLWEGMDKNCWAFPFDRIFSGFDIIVDKSFDGCEDIDLLLVYLFEQLPSDMCCWFPTLKENSILMSMLYRFCINNKTLNIEMHPRSPNFSCEDFENFDDYLVSKGKHFRKRVRQEMNKMERYKIEAEWIDSEHKDINSAIELFLQSKLKQFGESSNFLAESTVSIVRELFPKLILKGYMQLLVLKNEGKIVGSWFEQISTHSIRQGYQFGYDKDMQRLSLSMLMFTLAMQKATLDGIIHYDLSTGSTPLKERISSHEVNTFRIKLN